MNMKRLLSASIAAIMAIGLLAGCNGGASSGGEKFEDTEETLTLKWLGYPTNAGASEGTVPELALEEKFNVDIQPLFYEQEKFNDKKTMLMAGGEIPDLIYELDPMNMVQDVDQDFIVEIPYETIEKYAPEYYNYLNEYVPAAWIYSRYEEKNWGVPNYNHGHMISQQAVYRGDWLKKFNLEVPETLDELHDVLYKFTHEDPDGNGKNDTFGLSNTVPDYYLWFSEIFGAYGNLPFDWEERDGKIVYGGLTDECKEALKTLTTWYSEGIIDRDFVLGTGNAAKIISGKMGYMTAIAYYTPADTSFPQKVKANHPGAEIVLGPLPKGPEGKSGVRHWGRACHVVSFGNTEGYGVKVPRILKIMEGIFTDPEFAKKIKVGNEGEHWESVPDSIGSTNFEMIGDYKVASNVRLAGLHTSMAGPSFFSPIVISQEDYNNMRSPRRVAFDEEWLDEKYCLTDYFFKVDVVPSSADYLIDLRNQQMALMSDIITGVKSIDDYATFEKNWENGGGKVMTEEANELKKELDSIYAEIGVK